MPEINNDTDPFAELQNALRSGVDEAVAASRPMTAADKPFVPMAAFPPRQPPFSQSRAAITAAAPPATPPATVPARSDLEAFMTSGEKMLELQRSKISTARSRYELERARMVDDYRTRIEALEHEGGESLRQLDIAHEKELGEAEHLIEVLTAMRDIKRR